MSAGSRWKRPRDRDATDLVGKSQYLPHEDLRLPLIFTKPHHIGPNLGEQSETQSQRQSLPPIAPPTIASPSPHRRVGFLDEASQDGPSQWTLPVPMLHYPKKPRLGDYQFTNSQPYRPQSSSTHSEAQTYGRDEPRQQSRVGSEVDEGSRALQGWTQTGSEPPNQNGELPQIHPVRRNFGSSATNNPCPTCSDSVVITDRLVRGLRQLQLELALISNRAAVRRRPSEYEIHESDPATASEHGLLASLDWALDRVNLSIRLAQDISRTQDSPPRLQEQNYNTFIQRTDSAQDRRWRQERPESNDCRAPSGSSPPSEDGRRISDVPGTPLTSDGRQRFFLFNPTSAHTAYPPSLQSPMHAPSSSIRHLPSPSATNTSNVLPPISPSYKMGNSPHTAHLQELQHQLSTKSLAHQILQGEHEKLLAAISRSQTRCATLDKKSKVSDQEINDLAEDRGRLQALVDGLEQQVEELQVSRDEAWRESAGSGKQYAEIMEQGMQLQIKGLDELRKWNEDRTKWEAERQETQLQCTCKVRRVEEEPIAVMPERAVSEPSPTLPPVDHVPPAHRHPPAHRPPITPPPATSEDILMSTSLTSLRAEIVRLRNAHAEVQAALKNQRAEYVHIDNIIDQLKAVNARIRGREDEEEFSKGRPRRTSQGGGAAAANNSAHNVSRGDWARKEHTSSGPGSILFDDDAELGDHQNEDYGDF